MTIRDGMSAKLKRITSAFQKMERAARSADKATQAVNPGRTLENSASLIDRARKRLDAFINRQRDAGKGAEEVSDAWSRTEGLIKKALAVFSVAAVKGQIQKALEEFSNQYNAEVQLGVVMKNAGMDQKAFDAIRDRASALESKTTFGGDTFVAGAAELGTYAATAVSWIAQVVVDNWPTVSAILTAIAIVLLPAMISRLWATVAPVLAQAAAWALANAPLIMMIALVALLISAAMDAGVTIEDVVGFVGGLLGGLYAFGYNLIADIWNFIATFAEFFANVFVDPIGSIERLFLGLADSVLGVLETIANAIDAVFGSSLSDAVGNWRSGLQAKIEASYGENAVRYDRMEKIDTASTAAAWSTGAKGIANNLSQITGKLDSLTSSWDVSRSTGAINGGDLDSVGSVGKIDSDVNIADEDLKFLRDVAEMRYVQNFVTLTPTVAMDAQISERVDLDDVVSAIERKLEGEFIAAAEGVYN